MHGLKTIILIGVLVAAIVAIGILLGSGRSGSLDLGGAGAGTAGPAAASPEDPPVAGPREAAGPGLGTVSGRVVRFKDRAAVADVIVRLGGGPAGFEPRQEVTGPEGRFRFEEVPAGRAFEILVVHGEFAPVRRPGLAVAQGEETEVGTLFLERAVSLLVRVADGSGAAVAEAGVGVYHADPPTTAWTPGTWVERTLRAAEVPTALASGVTDGKGEVRIADLPAGYYAIVAEAEGYARAMETRLLSPENQDEAVEIRIGKGFRLAGTVTGADGQPIEGQVLASPSTYGAASMNTAIRAAAAIAEDGSYELSGLYAGGWTLLVVRPGSPPWPGGTVSVPEIGTWNIDMGAAASLQGTVTDEREKPVAGAEVRALVSTPGNGGTFGAVATTDAEGKYRLDGLPAGPVSLLEVLKSGYARYPSPGDPRPPINLVSGETTTQDVTMPDGVTLAGHVTRKPDGDPVRGARVVAVPRGVRTTSSLESVVTSESGAYAFDSLAPGEYVLLVEGEDCCQPGLADRWTLMRGRGQVDDQYLVLIESGPDPILKDLEVEEGAKVSGRVEDSQGNPVAGITVRVSNDPSREPVITGPDGEFRFTGVRSGEQVFAQAWTTGRWGQSERFHVPTVGEVTGIIVRLGAPGRIEGVLEIADGSPPDGATVAAIQGDVRQNPWVMTQARQAKSFPVGPDGRFTVEDVAPGTVTVVAFVPGYPDGASEAIPLPEGGTRTGVRIRIEAGRQIDGIVVDPEGKPVEGAAISLLSQTRPSFGPVPQTTVVATSGPDGSFVVSGLAEDRFQVFARKEGMNPAYEQGVASGTETNLRLELSPGGEVAGRVTDSVGTPLPDIRVTLQSTGGKMVDGVLQDLTGPDGVFRITGVPDGSLRLTAAAERGKGMNYVSALQEGVKAGETSLQIRLEAGLRIAGRVTRPDGRPAVGASVNVALTGLALPGGNQRLQADRDGRFDVTGLPPGDYQLNVTAAGGWAPLVLPGVRAGTEGLTLVLSLPEPIEGMVYGPDGTPLAGVTIQAAPMEGMGGSPGWANTNREGVFQLRNLAQSSYRITFQAPGRFATQVLEDVASGSKGLSVTLSEGISIKGVLLDPDGNPAPRVALLASDPAMPYAQVGATTDDEGKFVIKALAEGTYTLRVVNQADGWILHPEPKVAAGKEDVSLRLVRGLAIAGRILDADGRALANTWVSIVGRNQQWIRGDEGGNFRLPGLAPGDYTLQVWGGGRNKQLKVRAGDTAVQVLID